MQVHGYTRTGSIDATIDGVRLTVPDRPGNRHRQMIAEWEAAGNTIPEYEEPPAPPRTEGSYREFMNLFTEPEKDAIYAAEASAAAQGDFTLKKWMDRARGGATMRLTHPDTIAGVGMLVAAGLLAQERADEILSADFDAI